MRSLALAAAAVAAATCVDGRAAEQIVSIRLTPDPSITAYIDGIQGPSRLLWIPIRGADSSRSKRQRVTVRGPLGKSDIAVLVHSTLGIAKLSPMLRVSHSLTGRKGSRPGLQSSLSESWRGF